MGELKQVLEQPDHPVRLAYNAKVQDFIQRLRSDPALQDRVQMIKAQIINHPGVHSYVDGLIHEVKDWLRRDLGREDSALAAHLRATLETIGRKMADDADLRMSINGHILGASERLVGDLRETVTGHIAHTVKSWDDATMVREMELSVGKDLQYIRLNGTVVGGLVGVFLYGAAYFVPTLLAVLH